MRCRILSFWIIIALAFAMWHATADDRPRLVILTDIGGDPDDQQSMIRLMLYANEFEIEGLIATAAGIPGELKEEVTRPELIRQIVEAYGQVQPNLAKHDAHYPAPEKLLAIIKTGNPKRGPQAIGENHDTEGSKWVLKATEKDDPRPLNIVIWGGQTDLAQALWRARKEGGAAALARLSRKLRIYDIGDQDKIADWLLEEFPDLFYVLGRPGPGQDRRETVYRGMYLGGDESLTSKEWAETNIKVGHGPLGALYPMKTWTAPNPHSTLKEGDTPSWFYFLPRGLNDPGQPEWGGWGGRFQWWKNRTFRDAIDEVGGVKHTRVSVSRWRPAFQSEFQARMDWCLQPVGKANHAPKAVLNGDGTRNILRVNCLAGDGLRLSAAGSTDPDGHELSYRWWIYREPSSFPGPIELFNTNSVEVTVHVPREARGALIHLILDVKDKADPPLTAYRRAILVVE